MERALNSGHTTTELAPVDGRRGSQCGKRKATKVPKGDSVYHSGKLGCYLLLGGPPGITGMRSSRVLWSPGTVARQVGRLLSLRGLISVFTHYGHSCPHSFLRLTRVSVTMCVLSFSSERRNSMTHRRLHSRIPHEVAIMVKTGATLVRLTMWCISCQYI